MVPLVPSSVQPIECRRNANPFIFSPQLVHQLQLLTFARKALALAYRLARPRPLPSARGRPPTYADETILVTVIVMAIWQLSPYQMADRLARWPALAVACGYDPAHTISASQLYRRRDQLGLVAYFVTFCALVWQLIRCGIIRGQDLVLDSTLIDAFSRQDLDAAWHFAKRFGYKVHMLICRDALLPVMFLVTPANRNDAPWAVPLLELFRHCFALPVRVVRADAAYLTRRIIAYICFVLRPISDTSSPRCQK